MAEKKQVILSQKLPSDIEFESYLQYGGESPSSLYADARRELYKYAVDGKDMWVEIARVVSSEGNGYVLDVATGSAPVLKKLAELGYRGTCCGLDIDEGHFGVAEELFGTLYPQADVQFIVGSATKLPYEDNSVHVLVEANLRYHLTKEQQEISLAEYRRVLKPRGLLIVSSRDEENQESLWRLGGLIADRLDAPRPQSFYLSCDLSSTEAQVSRFFAIEHERSFVQDCDLRIPIEGWPDVRLALQSLRTVMAAREEQGTSIPSGTKMDHIIDTDIRQIFELDIYGMPGITPKGYFSDRVKQGFFCARNNK